MKQASLAPFLLDIKPHEKAIYNLAGWFGDPHSPTGAACRALERLFSEWQQRQGLTEIEIYRCVCSVYLSTSAGLVKFKSKSPVKGSLLRLKPELRMVVLLHDLLQMDYAKIASILGTSPAEVQKRMLTARRNLRESTRLETSPFQSVPESSKRRNAASGKG